MSDGPKRRFPRTTRAVSPAGVTIERDKIRRRQPNDMRLDDSDAHQEGPFAPVESPDEVVMGSDDLVMDDARASGVAWGQKDSDSDHAQVWEDEPEDDWGREPADGWDEKAADTWEDEPDNPWGENAAEVADDAGGVVWEDDHVDDDGFVVDDGLVMDDGDDGILFEPSDDRADWAPEVELAGRRDIRPKPPKPAPRMPPEAPGRPTDNPRAGAPRARQPGRQAGGGEVRGARVSPVHDGEVAFAPAAGAGIAGASGVSQKGRFARTQSSQGEAEIDFGRHDEEVLNQPRRAPASARRRPSPSAKPPTRSSSSGPRRRQRRKGGLALKVLGLIAVLAIVAGGWFAYSSGQLAPLIDRVAAALPIPGSGRTAADSAFEERLQPDAESADQALADLEEQIRQQSGVGGRLEVDPAIVSENGPPIPKFKPLPGTATTRSLSGTAAADGAQFAANGDDDEVAPSIFEKLWRYLTQG